MSAFIRAANRLINKHGQDCTYFSVTQSVYDVNELKTTNTETSYSVKMFKNHLKVSQYNYPNLVGKEVIEFYLANNSQAFVPKVRDKITCSGIKYTIDSIQQHSALGETVMWCIIAVKN